MLDSCKEFSDLWWRAGARKIGRSCVCPSPSPLWDMLLSLLLLLLLSP